MSTETEQMSSRRAQLRGIADAYFNGLAQGDVSRVPYDEDAGLRTPLAPGGSEVPLRGRAAVLEFFAGIYAAIATVRVIEYFFNDELTSICVRADITLQSGNVLRVADIFLVSADGKVTEQENHYDPRPAG